MGWFVGQVAKIAGPRVLIGVVAVGVVLLGGLATALYLTVQDKGELKNKLAVTEEVARNNAERVDELKADIERRDRLDAAYEATLARIDMRFDKLEDGIEQAVKDGASEAYLQCRPVVAPAGVLDRLRDGAREANSPR